uniref:Uncharacterized protein n=1 Tax=Populus trichocarpa TaxID=3694 RepID=A0A3N7FU83_POPTR
MKIVLIQQFSLHTPDLIFFKKNSFTFLRVILVYLVADCR